MNFRNELEAANAGKSGRNDFLDGDVEEAQAKERQECQRQKKARQRKRKLDLEANKREWWSENIGPKPAYLESWILESNMPLEKAVPQTKEEKAPIGMCYPGSDGNWHFDQKEARQRGSNGGTKSGRKMSEAANARAREVRQRWGAEMDDPKLTKKIATMEGISEPTLRDWRKRTKGQPI